MVTAVLPHSTETWPGDTFSQNPNKQSLHTPRWPILLQDTEAQATVTFSFPFIALNAANSSQNSKDTKATACSCQASTPSSQLSLHLPTPTFQTRPPHSAWPWPLAPWRESTNMVQDASETLALLTMPQVDLAGVSVLYLPRTKSRSASLTPSSVAGRLSRKERCWHL